MAKLGKIGKTFYLYYTDPVSRKTRRKSLHTTSKADAMSALAEHIRINRNADQTKTPLFSTAYANFLLVKNYPKQSTKLHTTAKNHFLTALPDKPLNQYTQEDYFDLVKYFTALSKARNTIAFNLKKIITFFNWCIFNGIITQHPFKPVTETVNEIRIIPEDYFSAILQKITGKQIKDALLVLWFTGLRIGELLSLRVQDLDFEQNLLYINNTKARRSDVIPMIQEVREILEGHKWRLRDS